MPFWNPQQYDPNMQQFGMNLLQQGMGGPAPTGIGGSISNLGNTLVGALMMRGQNKAQTRAREKTTGALERAAQMKQKTKMAEIPTQIPGVGSGPMGMPNMAIGTGEVEVEAETQHEFQSRQQQAKLKALLSSEIPEFKAIGEELMLKSLTAGPGEYKYFQGPNGEITAISPTAPTTPLTVKQRNRQVNKISEIDTTKPHMVEDPNTGESWLVPATDAPPDKIGATPVALKNGNFGLVNQTTQEIIDTGEKMGQKPGSGPMSVNVNLPGEPTKTHTTKLQEKALETSMGLQDMYGIYDRLEEYDESDEFFTYAGKGKNWVRQLGEKMGVELSDEDLGKLENYSDFQTAVWRMANTYIQRITGAQVSHHEVKRLMNAIPNMNDSKTVFMAKLRYVTETTDMAHKAYMNALKGYGFTPHQWAAGEVPQEVLDQAEMGATAVTKTRVDTYEAMSDREWNKEGADRARSAKIRRRDRGAEQQRLLDEEDTTGDGLTFSVGKAGRS